MKQTTLPTRAAWLRHRGGLLLLLLSLATCWPALAQPTSPFAVRVAVAGSTSPTTTPPVLTAQAVSLPFVLGTDFDGTVNAVLVQPDGKVVVGGSFTHYRGAARNYLVRLLPNGDPDTAFLTAGGIGLEPSLGAVGSGVRALALQSNGRLVVGGYFGSFAGTVHNNLVRLLADGSLDTAFPAQLLGAGVQAIALQAMQNEERILLGGSISQYANNASLTNSTALFNLTRLRASGALDTDFANNGFDGPVLALLVQATGIVVGGSFQNSQAAGTGSVAQNRVSRLTLAGAYNPFSNPVSFAYGSVKTLAPQPNGDVVAGGDFYVGLGTNPGIVRMKAGTGALEPGFPSAVLNQIVGVGASVNVLVAQAGDTLLVGGNFSSAAIGYNHLIQIAGAGVPTGFATTSGGSSSFGTTLAQGINALAVQPDGKVVAGGDFLAYNGTTSQRLARLTRTATLDLTETPLGSATYVWSDGSTGPNLTAVATGSYSATATVRGQAAQSPVVQVTRPTAAPTFSVRVTPSGPMRVCPNTPQDLVALAVANGTTTLPGSISYQWYRVVGAVLTPVTGTPTATYTVPASAAGTVGYYVAKATYTPGIGTPMEAASPTVAVTAMLVPVVGFASGTSSFGAPGTVLTLTGSNLDAVTGVLFGTQAATFTRTSATQLRVVVPGIGYNGPVTVQTPCASASTSASYRVLPSITGFVPQAGPAGTLVTVTGTGLTGASAVTFSTGSGTVSVPATPVSGTQFTVVVPATAATGAFSVVAATGETSSGTPFTVTSGATTTLTAPATTLPLAAYANVDVATGATLNLTQSLAISGQLIVRSGATLNTGLFQVTGGGGLVLEPGATLLTAHAQGLSASGATGAIVLTGARRYAPDATYGYTGTTAQATGDGLPAQVRNLRCANTVGLTLSAPVAVAQLLTVASTGNFLLNGNMLTLRSGPDGTALVYNQGTGVVVGAATAQRYIDPRVNPTAGFRYYGAPVRGAAASQLPAPVFAFDEARITASGRRDTTAAINYGFVPGPLQPGTVLEAGRGYRAAVPAATTVGFVGTLTTDTLSLLLKRSLPAPFSGWHLVSNPYPSPLDWSLVDPADRPGLDAAIYVYESTGPGTGYFRSYVNSVGTGSPLIAAGQAFFVRVSGTTPGGTGRLRFRNTQRVTVFDNATQPVFNRPTQTPTSLLPELVIVLERNGGCHPCRPAGTSTTQTPVPAELNSITVYTDPNATAGFDRLLDADAGNLFSPAQQTLGMRSSGPDTLAVQALPAFSATTSTEVPLTQSATTPGSFRFTASAVLLPALLNGADAYLRDASVTPNLYTPLADGTVVSFTLTAAELLAKVRPTRFYLFFGKRTTTTAATTGVALASATVYPNPARERIGVQVPGVPGATQVQATLLNLLGQVLLRHTAALPATGAALSLPVPGLASGVYLLRLQAGSSTTTRRVVLE